MNERGHIDPWRFAGMLTGCLICGLVWATLVYLLGIEGLLFVVGTMLVALACMVVGLGGVR